MYLSIAQIAVELALTDPTLEERWSRRYAGFFESSTSAPAFSLLVEVQPDRAMSEEERNSAAQPAFSAQGDLSRIQLHGEQFAGTLDFETNAGKVSIPDSLPHLDLFLRVILGVRLLREGGALFHASAVIRDGFSLAFSGPSGTGKSTVARLCREQGLPVLADEMVAFRRLGRGHRFFGTPFWNGSPLSAPAGGLLFLEQAGHHRITHLNPAEALPRLVAAGGAPLKLEPIHRAFFTAAAETLRRVPAYLLEFTPDVGFWDLLDQRPEFAFFRPSTAQPLDPRPVSSDLDTARHSKPPAR